MSRKAFRKLSETDRNTELDEILSLPSTLPDLGFLGFNKDGVRLFPESVAHLPSEPKPPASAVEAEPKSFASNDIAEVELLPISTVEINSVSTVEAGSTTAVEANSTSAVEVESIPPTSPLKNLWISEYGDIVPEKRTHKIKLAQNALTPQEQVVYKSLWAAQTCLDREPTDAWRIVQVGYKALASETNISKRSLKPIIERLVHKQCCLVEHEGLTDRTAAVYRVYSYRSILDRLKAQRRTHVVRIGAGLLFAKPLDQTVETGLTSTVEANLPSTVEPKVRSTVEWATPSTVEVGGGLSIGINSRNNHKESPPTNEREIREFQQRLRGEVAFDDDAVSILIRRCRDKAPDCTVEELASLAKQKLPQARTNKIGFVLEALPKLLAVGAHHELRKHTRTMEPRHFADERSREELIQEFQGILNNPDTTEQEKEWAARVAKQLGAKPN
jgi:hypothetical protein